MSSAAPAVQFDATGRPLHSAAFRFRRFLNWFPLGLTYAFLYWGRYNLTVAKNALGQLMTKEDFGIIFSAGTVVYAISFIINGPLTDRLGGKKAILAASLGSMAMNSAMGTFIYWTLTSADPSTVNMRLWMSLMYAVNMYFQSFAAVAVIKVNAHWFHLRERGGFSGIFGTMISSGLFLAYTVTGLVVDAVSKDLAPGERAAVWWAFFAPAIALGIMFVTEFILLKDSPKDAGFGEFETGDADHGSNADGSPVAVGQVLQNILRNPIILTIGFIEFCTGVLRNGVMHWFPIYAKEVWVLPNSHPLLNGDWSLWTVGPALGVVILGLSLTSRGGKLRTVGFVVAIAGLVPFVPAGWGGFLFAAGVFGGNVAGWVSDLLFQSRRAPAAGGLYAVLAVAAVGMLLCLGGTSTKVAWSKEKSGQLKAGDMVLAVEDQDALKDWSDIARAYACVQSACVGGSLWDSARCMCTEKPESTANAKPMTTGTITFRILRDDVPMTLEIPDHAKTQRAGDKRILAAGPQLTLSPLWMALLVFILSFCVIGTHGLLSGAASMDFGGKRAAATAAGLIDGFVYLGTALQSISLGYITSRDWTFWPVFLVPFALLGFYLCTRIWTVKPGPSTH